MFKAINQTLFINPLAYRLHMSKLFTGDKFLKRCQTQTSTHVKLQIYIPGKIKMKKALIPPMRLMTSPMSGTNMAMRRVTVIQITVRTTLQRLSKEWVTIPKRRLWMRSTRFRMTDLSHTHTHTHRGNMLILTHKLKQCKTTLVSLTSPEEE